MNIIKEIKIQRLRKEEKEKIEEVVENMIDIYVPNKIYGIVSRRGRIKDIVEYIEKVIEKKYKEEVEGVNIQTSKEFIRNNNNNNDKRIVEEEVVYIEIIRTYRSLSIYISKDKMNIIKYIDI